MRPRSNAIGFVALVLPLGLAVAANVGCGSTSSSPAEDDGGAHDAGGGRDANKEPDASKEHDAGKPDASKEKDAGKTKDASDEEEDAGEPTGDAESDDGGEPGDAEDSGKEGNGDATVEAGKGDGGTKADGSADGGSEAAADGGSEASASVCGNGVIESGEACDNGAKNSDIYNTCSSKCAFTSLLLWLDGTDPNGTGITPADGAAGTVWVDKAAGHTVQQTVVADQPTYRVAGLSGHPAFQFNGTTDFFDVDLDIGATSYPDLTVVVVIQNATPPVGLYSGIWGQDVGGWTRFLSSVGTEQTKLTTQQSGVSNGVDFTAVPSLNLTGEALVVTTILRSNTANASAVYINGTSEVTFTGSVNKGSTHMSVGSLNAPSNFETGYSMYGYIGQVLVYGTAIADATRAALETSLESKY